MAPISVVLVGIDPDLIDFSAPAYSGFPGLDAAKIRAGLEADAARLRDLGYDPEICFVDLGQTAEAVVRERLRRRLFDAVMIGAGVRLIPENTALFEKLLNVIHVHAPQAKFCFNTRPTDTAEAVQRWFPAGRS
ncbi:hypothetical protein [Methylobacterium oxalidis]|uniref:Uncharacterized protein n=1 Tax=Methylobacterium oxalidis TaxID=944322 RepID=A0A512IY09_9HYPH|nr:hypothetical protein [Methylobacterium oxalidis]GEP02479.1 hypothetical protein MOX02_05170 [Methylobacterium oxalidis]GJE31993.1 hypothetical protein LDDCCGHA_2175 [Methylobacterium oxalidis]GLS67858.1 hypothetical protein GCM10007888_62430 [Methylobacterium oxalidis]